MAILIIISIWASGFLFSYPETEISRIIRPSTAERKQALKEFILANAVKGVFELQWLVEEFNLPESVIKETMRSLIKNNEIKPFYEVVEERDGKPTGIIKRYDLIHRDGDWCRTVHIVVIDNDGEFLFRFRSPRVPFPNKWDIASGGHLFVGEDYLTAAVEIMAHQLGIRPNPHRLKLIGKEGRFRQMGSPDNPGDSFQGPELFRFHRVEGYAHEFSSLYFYILSPSEKALLGESDRFKFVDLNEEIMLLRHSPADYAPAFRRYFSNDLLVDEIICNIILDKYPQTGQITTPPQTITTGRGKHLAPIFIETTNGKYILRPTDKSIEELRFIISAVNHLIAEGLPMQPILKASRPQGPKYEDYFYIRFGKDYYILTKYIDGEIITLQDSREVLTPERIKNGTIELARLNWAGMDFIPQGESPPTFTLDLEDKKAWFKQLKSEIEANEETHQMQSAQIFLQEYDFIMNQLELLSEAITQIGDEVMRIQTVIHGDYSRYNLVFEGDEIAGIVDYDKMQYNARIWDLIHWILSAHKNPADFDLSLTEKIINWYQSVNRLSPEEIKAIPEFIRYKLITKLSYIACYYMFQGFWPYLDELRASGLPETLWGIKLMELNPNIFNFFMSNLSTLKVLDAQDWEEFFSAVSY